MNARAGTYRSTVCEFRYRRVVAHPGAAVRKLSTKSSLPAGPHYVFNRFGTITEYTTVFYVLQPPPLSILVTEQHGVNMRRFPFI